MNQDGNGDGQVLQQRTTYSVNVELYEIPPDDEDEDAGVLGAGLPTEAAGDEETTFAGAEEEGKPWFFSGSVPSFSVPPPPDPVEGKEGTPDSTIVGRAASAVPVP